MTVLLGRPLSNFLVVQKLGPNNSYQARNIWCDPCRFKAAVGLQKCCIIPV